EGFPRMGRIEHRHDNLLMVILIIHEDGVAILKSEREPPVATHPYRIMAGQIAFQRMKLPTRHIHLLRHRSGVKHGQLAAKFCRMDRLDAGGTSRGKEILQSLVAKTPDH